MHHPADFQDLFFFWLEALITKTLVFQKSLFLIPAVISPWTKAPAGTILSAGTMTSRPTLVPSFGMEAVVGMKTGLEQRVNARKHV